MNKQHDISVIRRVFLLSTIILWSSLVGVFFFSQWFSEFFPNYYVAMQTSLMLFMIWLVTTSTLRSLQQFIHHVSGMILLLVGTLVTGLGVLFYWAFLGIYGALTIEYAVDFSWEPVGVFTALGLVVSLMTLINLRIKNRTVGNALEISLMVIVMAIILFLTT